MEKLTDFSPMPYGPYKGVAMANVPADYLLNQRYKGCTDERVNAYITDNLDALNQEIEHLTNLTAAPDDDIID